LEQESADDQRDNEGVNDHPYGFGNAPFASFGSCRHTHWLLIRQLHGRAVLTAGRARRNERGGEIGRDSTPLNGPMAVPLTHDIKRLPSFAHLHSLRAISRLPARLR